MQVTINEARVLRAILTNKLNALKGVIPATYDAEALTAELRVINVAHEPSGLTGPAFSGVMASLFRKKLVLGAGGKGTKSQPWKITLTPAGFNVAAIEYDGTMLVQVPACVNVAAAKAKAEAAGERPDTCYATDALLAGEG